ncbi:MAG: hypothetical protein CM15mV73_520 [Caudoviricetes sp.]|nr:MAG: hypothetical protein CM15mV73_520 [Caudoviricetes sp.]
MACKNAQVKGCVMLRKIKLYSKLADFIGHKEFDAFVKSR